MTELSARLDHGVPLTVVDGIEVADTDAADATMAEAKARIEALEAELAGAQRWRDAFEFLNVQQMAQSAAAEAHCKRLEEALRPFAGERLPSSKRSEISRNEWGLRCLMSPLEIARQAARLALQENTNDG